MGTERLVAQHNELGVSSEQRERKSLLIEKLFRLQMEYSASMLAIEANRVQNPSRNHPKATYYYFFFLVQTSDEVRSGRFSFYRILCRVGFDKHLYFVQLANNERRESLENGIRIDTFQRTIQAIAEIDVIV